MNYNMINGINLTLDLPYPKIPDLEKDIKLAYLIKKSYAGEISELTSVNKYMYQHMALDKEYKDIKEALKIIGIVEMRHLDILGELIKNLGLLPTYTSINKLENENYWNSSYVYYNLDLRDMLINNIKGEEKAIKNYNKIIKETNSQKIIDILNRIILDEEHHIKIFQSILNNLI